MSSSAPRHPFRVTRPVDGPPLSRPQLTVLTALVHLCPFPGASAPAPTLARATGLAHGSVVIVLRSLVAKGLVLPDGDATGRAWAPTMTGRARVRHAAAFGGAGARRLLVDGTPLDATSARDASSTRR